jgi:hypothetical protein
MTIINYYLIGYYIGSLLIFSETFVNSRFLFKFELLNIC